MRLFVGIDLPPEILDTLDRLLRRLRPAARIKWSPPANMHITTKFIGEWPADQLDELVKALGGIAPPGEIPVSIRGLGWFPNQRAPRVFWAGIEAGDGLEALARETDASMARLGIERDRRRFSPHLTLARIKSPMDLTALHRAVNALDSVDFGSFTATSFFLYESELRPSGSVYTKLAGFPLEKR
jgi:2'-5' RNA ligase